MTAVSLCEGCELGPIVDRGDGTAVRDVTVAGQVVGQLDGYPSGWSPGVWWWLWDGGSWAAPTAARKLVEAVGRGLDVEWREVEPGHRVAQVGTEWQALAVRFAASFDHDAAYVTDPLVEDGGWLVETVDEVIGAPEPEPITPALAVALELPGLEEQPAMFELD